MASMGPSPKLAINKPEYMKVNTINFIENERMSNYGGVHEIVKTSSAVPAMKISDHIKKHTDHFIENEKKCNFVQIPDVEQTHEQSVEEQPVFSRSDLMANHTTETREEAGTYAPKRYTTTCYFKPKQNPVSYSETVILVLGSSKKHYFDTVLYQTKLVPFRWTETLTTLIKPSEQPLYRTEHQAHVTEPQYHYISLEPQQIAASNFTPAVVA